MSVSLRLVMNWRASTWRRINRELLQCRVLMRSFERSHPFRAMLAPWNKTLPVTALVSPSSALSSFLTFWIFQVGSGMPGTGWKKRKKRLCVNVVIQEFVERFKKVRLSDVARMEKWRDCLALYLLKMPSGAAFSNMLKKIFLCFPRWVLSLSAFIWQPVKCWQELNKHSECGSDLKNPDKIKKRLRHRGCDIKRGELKMEERPPCPPLLCSERCVWGRGGEYYTIHYYYYYSIIIHW